MKLSPTMFHPDAFSYGSQSTPIKLEERSGRPSFQSSAPHFPLGETIYSREVYLYYDGELCRHYTILFTLGGLPEANRYASDRYAVSYTGVLVACAHTLPERDHLRGYEFAYRSIEETHDRVGLFALQGA